MARERSVGNVQIF